MNDVDDVDDVDTDTDTDADADTDAEEEAERDRFHLLNRGLKVWDLELFKTFISKKSSVTEAEREKRKLGPSLMNQLKNLRAAIYRLPIISVNLIIRITRIYLINQELA